MADYSRDDSAYAERIVGSLMGGESKGLELEPGLAVSDLERDALQFSDEMALLDDFGAPFPAMQIAGETVPASLQITSTPYQAWLPGFPSARYRYWRRNPYLYEGLVDALRHWYERGDSNGLTTMDREEARTTFTRRAIDFLAGRVASVRIWRNHEQRQPWQGVTVLNIRPLASAAAAPAPGCHFTVSTNSSGLRVFWSGAYFISANNFNSPTTPTTSVLQSGNYVFGVDGGAYGNIIQWDQNNVVSLPGYPPYTHLNY